MMFRNKNLSIPGCARYMMLSLLILGTILLAIGYRNRLTIRRTFVEIMTHSSKNNIPNWRGIEPGKTTEADVDTIVSKAPDVFENLTIRQLQPEGIRYSWHDAEFQLPTEVTFHDNVVSYLKFHLSGSGTFPFENILNLAGSPMAYLAGSITDEFVHVIFFYEEIGVVISFFAIYDPVEMTSFRRNCNFVLTKNTRVNHVNIYFLEQNNLDSMTTTLFSGSILPGEKPELWTGIEDEIKLTSGQVYLADGTIIDCRNPLAVARSS